MSSRFLLSCLCAVVAGGFLNSLAAAAAAAPALAPGPVLLDDRFDLPPGFHVYRAADPELTGGSYDLAFDGEGRLLVGDGNAVRRLKDTNHDGVYDQFEVIATGLGGRGPQGLLVWGDRLYAVGGDGLQLFEGYKSGPLVHRGRLGAKFSTGGDHDLHTVFRGHDGWLYLMAGNGAGIEGRRHITETNSPMRQEREASVFRLDPDGSRWECVAAGGRNPPGLGMNYVGELFSFDSDMEWHVGLPFYKPVRLNHWAIGTDQGWQEVGAYPPYFIDCVPHVVAAGRGSPDWGVFYEHQQFPVRYRHALLNCDYRWKRESNDQYATSGRLVSFFLERDGAGWKARMETLARPKPGARDAQDRPVNFALVDVEVAPDGSLLLSDHNQGLWRIFYDARSSQPAVPPIAPASRPLPASPAALLAELLHLPQPLAEWSRVRAETIRAKYGEPAALAADLKRVSLDPAAPLEDRLRAIQSLAPVLAQPDEAWLRTLSLDASAEMRGQAAWLYGLRAGEPTETVETALLKLLDDAVPMVRRRATEGLTRARSPRVIPGLIARLNDESRLTRFIAMNALAHHPIDTWAGPALAQPALQSRLRALVAAHLSGQAFSPEESRRQIRASLEQLSASSSVEDQLDLLRVLALFEQTVQSNADLRSAVALHLLTAFPSQDRDVRWEQVRLLGLFVVENSFGRLLALLWSERDEVTQFHIAQALARLPRGWTAAEEEQALAWFIDTQQGWFAEFGSKGVEFPQFWATTVSEFASHHPEILVREAKRIQATSVPGSALVDVLVAQDSTGHRLIGYYHEQTGAEARALVGHAFRKMSRSDIAAFLRDELGRTQEIAVRAALWQSLAVQPVAEANVPLLLDGLRQGDPEVARACAQGLAKHRPAPTTALAEACLERMTAGSRAFQSCEQLLVSMSGRRRSDYQTDADPNRRPEPGTKESALRFWSAWYAEKFGHPFVSKSGPAAVQRTDEEVVRFILGDGSRGGNAGRGAVVYERLQCHTCHGGGAAPGREGRIFGPDLASVTRRLSRAELADALAYPSKIVADRFKAFELEKKDGAILTGFVTEKTDENVTFADLLQVHRVPRADIARLAPQTKSLMPESLLNALTDDETRDLLAFLENIGVAPQRP